MGGHQVFWVVATMIGNLVFTLGAEKLCDRKLFRSNNAINGMNIPDIFILEQEKSFLPSALALFCFFYLALSLWLLHWFNCM